MSASALLLYGCHPKGSEKAELTLKRSLNQKRIPPLRPMCFTSLYIILFVYSTSLLFLWNASKVEENNYFLVLFCPTALCCVLSVYHTLSAQLYSPLQLWYQCLVEYVFVNKNKEELEVQVAPRARTRPPQAPPLASPPTLFLNIFYSFYIVCTEKWTEHRK